MVAVRRTAAARRAGFTLIEILIAIAIISILAGLLLVGVGAARRAGKRFATTNEISQLALACENFKNEFKAYPPTYAGGFTIPKKVQSSDKNYQFLKRMFPHWIPRKPPVAPATIGVELVDGDDLNTSEDGALTNEGSTLDSNQSLIYFLGGPTGIGWNPGKPYAATAGAQSVKGPYYDFPSARLKTFPGMTLPWFVDTYGTPYAYFVSPTIAHPTAAAANTLLQFPLPTGPTVNSTPPANSASGPPVNAGPPPYVSWGWKAEADQSALGTIVTPYYSSANKAESPKGVQIISAGPDQRFGPGDMWNSTYKSSYALQSVGGAGLNPGGDDAANFNGGSLTIE